MRLPWIKACLAGLIALLVLLLVGYLALQQRMQTSVHVPHDGLIYAIKPGSHLSSVTRDLVELKLLPHPQTWQFYARLKGMANQIQAGEYRLEPGISSAKMLQMFVQGEVIQYQITFVEGHTFAQLRGELSNHQALQQRLTGWSDKQILDWLKATEAHPEGLFFADTYQYSAQSSDKDLLRRAYQRLQRVLAEEWQNRAPGLPFTNPYEALILASIIEKETAVESERQQIAGVFVRRLEKNMRLQTDPTVIYGLGQRYRGNLTRKHLREKTAYNTYRISGLPPTPIALVGRAAIHAALHPDDSDALYFVARGDGTHHFSATLDEHNRAVRKYQIAQRAKDYRSTPATP